MKPELDKARQEKNVRKVFARFSQAFLEADFAILDSMLSDDYIHINGQSGTVLSRFEWLDWIRLRRNEIEKNELQVDEYRVEDIIVKMHNNAAIVTGVVFSRGIRKDEAFASQVRFTNTWILFENVWKRVSFHDSPLGVA